MAEYKNTKSIIFISLVFTIALISLISAQGTVFSESSTSFNIFFDSPTCFQDISSDLANAFSELEEGKSYWGEDEAFKDTLDDCRRLEGVDQNKQPRSTCCPSEYSCNDDDLCAPNFEFGGCEQYLTKETCGEDSGHPEDAIETLNLIDSFLDEFPDGCSDNELFGNECRNFIDCRCQWAPSTGDNGNCIAISNHTVEKIPTGEIWSVEDQAALINAACSDAGSERTGACSFTFTYSGSCLNGDEFVTKSWTADYENSGASNSDPLGYCENGSEIIACERVIRLPFFGLQNIIVAIILLIIIYYILNKRKRR